MQIIATIHDISHLEDIALKADGFLIGTSIFAKHLTCDFKDNINEVIKKIIDLKKEVYIQLNRMYTDFEIHQIEEFLKQIDLDKVTGFMVADIGLLNLFKKYKIENKFIYNPETLLTNYFDFNYLKQDNIKGAFASKEITAKDILQIGEHKEIKLFYFAHGHMSMFYTKRQILTLYTNYIGKEDTYKFRSDLRLKEPKRELETYPVFEDNAGTHVFRGHVLSTLDHMKDLRSVLDYIVIDTLFQSDDYLLDVIDLYKNEEVNLDRVQAIKEKYNETWHEGFLSEKSMIKDEKND